MASTANTASAPSSAKPSGSVDVNRRPQESIDVSELPFLVTHWLHNFNPNENGQEGNSSKENSREKQLALERIRKATSELASAFTSLGAYGSSAGVSPTEYILPYTISTVIS